MKNASTPNKSFFFFHKLILINRINIHKYIYILDRYSYARNMSLILIFFCFLFKFSDRYYTSLAKLPFTTDHIKIVSFLYGSKDMGSLIVAKAIRHRQIICFV